MRIIDADMQQIYINTPQGRFTCHHEAKVILESSVIMLYIPIATINTSTKKYGVSE